MNILYLERLAFFFSSFFFPKQASLLTCSTVYPVQLRFVWDTPGLGSRFRGSLNTIEQLNVFVTSWLWQLEHCPVCLANTVQLGS